MYSDELNIDWWEDCHGVKEIYYLDTVNNLWVEKSSDELRLMKECLSELFIEQMKLVNQLNIQNTMTAGEQMDNAVKMASHLPALQSKIDSLTTKVEKMREMSDYVECEVCGSLVNKSKAQVFSSVESEIGFSFNMMTGFTPEPDKRAVLHYVCNHCDSKKYEKELKKGS